MDPGADSIPGFYPMLPKAVGFLDSLSETLKRLMVMRKRSCLPLAGTRGDLTIMAFCTAAENGYPPRSRYSRTTLTEHLAWRTTRAVFGPIR